MRSGARAQAVARGRLARIYARVQLELAVLNRFDDARSAQRDDRLKCLTLGPALAANRVRELQQRVVLVAELT